MNLPLSDTALQSGFHRALGAPLRAADIDAVDDVYGWLIGSWEMDVLSYRGDTAGARKRAEAHFGWVLEGRVVQDVWIMPPRRELHSGPDAAPGMYGTTLRIWDPALRAWRVSYFNPQTGQHDELIGRRAGRDIVQIGTHANGTPIRWAFTDIANDAFRWTGVALAADGVTWTLEAEFFARRVASLAFP